AVSHLPIQLPGWATLPYETPLYAPPPPLKDIPDVIFLDVNASCPCNGKRTFYVDTLPTTRQPCTVYTLTSAYSTHVDLQRCPNSNIRQNLFIGPDPRALGLFNFNNSLFFTHELLNDYTSFFTTSETPFTSWVKVIARRYQENSSSKAFVTDEVFRNVWFSFVNIQRLDGDMVCPQCGPTPSDTIWDGVTLAFNRKHLLSNLAPPTQIQGDAPAHTRKY
ncbi:hypothetical protein BDN72DRAFT_733318, partial [Pluteus cervinus]